MVVLNGGAQENFTDFVGYYQKCVFFSFIIFLIIFCLCQVFPLPDFMVGHHVHWGHHVDWLESVLKIATKDDK